MARQVVKLLDGVTTATTGTGKYIGQPCGITITTSGTTDVVITLKVSNNGTDYGTVYSATYSSATTIAFESPHGWPFYEADTSAHSAGSVTVLASF